MIHDELINGVIPGEIEAKTAATAEVARFTRRCVPLTAMLIAAARRDNFKNDLEGWADWCANVAGIYKSDKRCHFDTIGRMLLAVQATKFRTVFGLLYELDSEKLLAISRLCRGAEITEESVADVITFVNHFGNDLRDMSRDKIRLYVKKLRGEEVPEEDGIITDGEKKSAQMMLPGFERSVDLFRDLTPETASSMVKSRDVANKAGYAGYLLVNSYVNYAHAHDGFARAKDLTILKSRLLDLIDRIDALDLTDDDAPEIAACDNGMKFTQEEEPAEDVPEDLAEEVPEIAACGNEDPENEFESGFEDEQNNNEVYAKSIAAAAKEGSKKVKKTADAESEEAGRKNMTADAESEEAGRKNMTADAESEEAGRKNMTAGAESERVAWTPEVLTPDDRRKITEQMGYDFDIGSVIGSD